MFLFFGAVLLLAGCLLEASAFANLARSRLREHATLRALGLDRKGLVQVMLLEGTLWGGLAAIFGVILGAVLGASLVGGLNTFWADAVESATIPLALTGGALWLALGIGLLVTVGTLFLAARKAAKAEMPSALSDRTGSAVEAGIPLGPRLAVVLGITLIIAPAALGIILQPSSDMIGLAVFFLVGTVATIGGTLLALPLLGSIGRRVGKASIIAPWRMGLRSLNRRPGRALLLVSTFALVSFAVIGISWAGEIEVSHAGDLKVEQTGGYDVLAETWVPVGGDLKDEPGAPPGDWVSTPVKIVGHQGGTCSNLNARFPPRVMGVPPEFIENVTVGFRASDVGGDRATWRSLDELTPQGRVPVVVDSNTLIWVYGGELGEVYEVDGDRGRVYEFEVVGIMDTSIFAGSFITGVDLVDRVYPDSATFTYFLLNSGSKSPEKLSTELEDSLGSLGLDARPTEDVVKENLGYELSFLRLFQVYLALGLVVGALGLGALAVREVRDRRREIGAMRALGWPKKGVWMTFLSEQVWFAGAGVIAGIVGAAISIIATSTGWLGSVSEIYVPGGTIALIAFLVVLSAALGALWAARDAANVEAVDALRSVE
jgi:putative ABC transport system permease protein